MRSLLLSSCCALLLGQSPVLPPSQRKDVSALAVQDPAQKVVTRVADARGRVVVLGVLVRWATASRALAKELDWLQAKEASTAVYVLPVFRVQAGPRPGTDNPTELAEWAKNYKDSDQGDFTLVPPKEYMLPLGFRAYIERPGAPGQGLDLLPALRKPPAAYLIDRQGRLAAVLEGYQKGLLTKTVQALLDEKD
ncbi:MAG: hypothetical protein HY823_08635 [Acidobacteria bacterium]|nr:hypothetical protein [Acidobacteriota bacterium]